MKTDDRMLALSRMSPALRQETTVGLLDVIPDKPLLFVSMSWRTIRDATD